MNENIRIGTIVKGGASSASYIRQINRHGFESYSIMFWQDCGISDWSSFAAEIMEAVKESGAVISSLGIFGNPLENGEMDLKTLQGWKDCIRHAALFNCDIVSGFTGRLRGKSIPDSIPRFKEVFSELADLAGEYKVRLAFENCDMGGSWLSGDWNIALTPDAWELIFEAVPHKNVGLQWEPCHQMVKLIDPMPQLDAWKDRIFHSHGKDAIIYHDILAKHGTGGAKQYAFHRTPGFGSSNWTEIISRLRRNGFKGSIDIEGWHDPVYRDDLEMSGQVHALKYLKNARGGSFVPNPV